MKLDVGRNYLLGRRQAFQLARLICSAIINNYRACIVTCIIERTHISLSTESTRHKQGNSHVARNPQEEEKTRRVVFMTLWLRLRDAAEIILRTHARTHANTQPFSGLWSGTTRVGRYQKKHSPTHTHPDHRTSFLNFLHLQINSILLVQFTCQAEVRTLQQLEQK